MEAFGSLLATIIAETLTVIEGTLAHYVNMTIVDGISPVYRCRRLDNCFCQNWSELLVSFAGAMNALMTALWTLS